MSFKRELNNALIRIVPLLLGIAVGRGWLSSEDASALEQILIVLAGLGLTYYASTSRPSVREKLADDVIADREKRSAAAHGAASGAAAGSAVGSAQGLGVEPGREEEAGPEEGTD